MVSPTACACGEGRVKTLPPTIAFQDGRQQGLPYGFGLAATAAIIVVATAALVAAAVAQQQNQDDDPPPVVVQASTKAVVITHIHTLRKQS